MNLDFEIDNTNNTLTMGILREPLDIDFVINPRPLTEEDHRAFKEAITKSKMQSKKSKSARRPSAKSH
jgi:hypothetical protein